MTEFKFQFTQAVVAVMNSWGWRFLGRSHSLDKQWTKYENGLYVATFGDEVWESDLVAARLATMREGEVMFALQAAMPVGVVVVDPEAAGSLVEEPVQGIEVWRAKPELRQMLAGPAGVILQQKWVRHDDGKSEWRGVPYVDVNGVVVV